MARNSFVVAGEKLRLVDTVRLGSELKERDEEAFAVQTEVEEL